VHDLQFDYFLNISWVNSSGHVNEQFRIKDEDLGIFYNPEKQAARNLEKIFKFEMIKKGSSNSKNRQPSVILQRQTTNDSLDAVCSTNATIYYIHHLNCSTSNEGEKVEIGKKVNIFCFEDLYERLADRNFLFEVVAPDKTILKFDDKNAVNITIRSRAAGALFTHYS